MCGSMADIQSQTAEIRQGKKKKKSKDKNIMVCPMTITNLTLFQIDNTLVSKITL